MNVHTQPDSNDDCNPQVENGTAILLPQIHKKSRHAATVADVIPVQATSMHAFMVNMQSCMTGVKNRALPAAEMSRS
jgi:hypothetical protein